MAADRKTRGKKIDFRKMTEAVLQGIIYSCIFPLQCLALFIDPSLYEKQLPRIAMGNPCLYPDSMHKRDYVLHAGLPDNQAGIIHFKIINKVLNGSTFL